MRYDVVPVTLMQTFVDLTRASSLEFSNPAEVGSPASQPRITQTEGCKRSDSPPSRISTIVTLVFSLEIGPLRAGPGYTTGRPVRVIGSGPV